MIKYLPLVLCLATSKELNSFELLDVFGTDVADNTLSHVPKYPELEIKRLNKSTFFIKNLIKSSTDRTVIPSNTLPAVRGFSQSIANTTENSINDFIYDQWSAILENGEPEPNNAFYGKIRTRNEETVNQDPLSTFLEVERLHANTTFTERSLNSSSEEKVHLDPLQAFLEVQRLHANGLLLNMSTMKTRSDESDNQDPWNHLLDIGRLSKRLATVENSTMTRMDKTVNRNQLNDPLVLQGLHVNTAPTERSMKPDSRGIFFHDPWNASLEVGKLRKSVTSTENSMIAGSYKTVYQDPLNALLEVERLQVNNEATERSIKPDTGRIFFHDPLNASLEVRKLSKSVTSTENSMIAGSYKTVYQDPLNALLEVERLQVNNEATERSIKPDTGRIFFHDPLNASLEVRKLSKSVTSTEDSMIAGSYKTVYQDPLNALLEVERLQVNNEATERSMKPDSGRIFLHDASNASLEVGKFSKSVTSTEDSMITRSYKTVSQDPLNALLEVERLQVNKEATERSMNSSSGKIVLQNPPNKQSEVERLSIHIATTKNSMETGSDETVYQNQINALRKVQAFHANRVFNNKRSMKTRSDKMVNQYLLNSFLELEKISKNASINKIDNEEPWDPLRELEKLNANSATTESSMTASSVDDVSQNSWSSLLKAGGLRKSVATTENLIASISNNINNQDSLNPLMKVEKLRNIVDTTMKSTASNITVKQESGNALPELEGLDKSVGTTEGSIIPITNITLGQKSTNVSLEIKRQVNSSIGVAESLVPASTNQTATNGFLKVTVEYRTVRPTPTTTKLPLSPLDLSGCPEEEKPRNFGAYEVPTQRDLVLQVRTKLLGSYRAYHRKALRVLKQMKEATKASWGLANSCHATSILMYQRCVRRVRQRCEVTGKSLVLALESLKEDVMDLIQGNICNISAMNVDPIQLIRILAMEKVSLEFALPGFLRLLNACNVYCSRGPTKYANFTPKRLQRLTDKKLVVEHFLTKQSYAQLIKAK